MTGAICCRLRAIVISVSLRSQVISNSSKQQQGQLQGVLVCTQNIALKNLSLEITSTANKHMDVVISRITFSSKNMLDKWCQNKQLLWTDCSLLCHGINVWSLCLAAYLWRRLWLLSEQRALPSQYSQRQPGMTALGHRLPRRPREPAGNTPATEYLPASTNKTAQTKHPFRTTYRTYSIISERQCRTSAELVHQLHVWN